MATPHGYMREKVRLYIENTLLHHGYSPSIREIQAAVGLKSTSTVHEHIKTGVWHLLFLYNYKNPYFKPC